MTREREAEAIRRVTELARDIESEYGLERDCGFDVLRYAVEHHCGVAEAVAKHRARRQP